MIAAEGKKIMQAPMKAAQSVASHIGQVVGGRAPQPAAAVSLSKPKAPAIPKAPISPTTVPVAPKAPATAAPVAPKAPKAPVAPGYAGNTIAEQAAANANKNKILQGPQTSGQTAAQVAMAPSGMSKAYREFKKRSFKNGGKF
jgi:hypothetical protein